MKSRKLSALLATAGASACVLSGLLVTSAPAQAASTCKPYKSGSWGIKVCVTKSGSKATGSATVTHLPNSGTPCVVRLSVQGNGGSHFKTKLVGKSECRKGGVYKIQTKYDSAAGGYTATAFLGDANDHNQSKAGGSSYPLS